MAKIKNLQDLFQHEILDLLSAETQLVSALPKMAEKASDKELKNAFKSHLEETKKQKERLEKVVSTLNLNGSNTCEAMKGLIKEGKEIMDADVDADTMDAALIAAAQRVEHYEIAGYGTVCTYAKMLGHEDAHKLLNETLQEEKKADQKLTKIAEDHVNRRARGDRAA
jgi:ferritin-like metal-binding protein YciE